MRWNHRATWPLLVALALVAVGAGWQWAVVAHSAAADVGSPSTSSSNLTASVSISGTWVIKTDTTVSNETVNVNGGVTIQSDATLTLTHVNLFLAEPNPLANRVHVESGSALVGVDVNIDSLTPANHLWIQADSGANLSLTGGSIDDLGGPGGPGVVLLNTGSFFDGVSFNNYYEAIVTNSAPDTTLTHLFLGNSTAGTTSAYAVNIDPASPGLTLTHSTFDIPQAVGALSVAAPDAKVVANHFTLDPTTPSSDPIHLTCANSGSPSASDSYFANNSIYGAGIIVDGASHVTIWGNSVFDTGTDGPFGIMAEVPIGTAPGLWSTGDVIENNYISDWSRYGIRLQQNVTDFVVRGNEIVNPSTSPGPPSTEKWGGLQLDGIYLIRGVNNGTVDHNVVDLSDLPNIASDGVSVESDVDHVRLTNNVFYNVTQYGMVLQGVDPSNIVVPAWESGPSEYLLVANNEFVNEREVQQTNFPFFGILDWMWANHTTVENNTFIDWQNTDTAFNNNGAVVLSEGSYGTYVNNTVEGARYGFIFTYFGGEPNAQVGEFNRSDNLVYGNHLYGITQQLIQETPNDGMGPLHNAINLLDDSVGIGGAPSGYLESIAAVTGLGISERGGLFTQSMTTTNPITGSSATFSTSMDWQMTEFSAQSTGSVGGGPQSVVLESVSATKVSYTLPTAATSEETVTVQEPTGSYNATYHVSVTGSSSSSFGVNSSTGPATFRAGMSGAPTITVKLLSWTPSPQQNTTPTVSVYGQALNQTDVPQGNLSVSVGFGSAQAPAYFTTTTNPDGLFTLENLTTSGNVSAVEVNSGSVPVTQYQVNTAGPDEVNLTVWVDYNASNFPTGPGSGANGTDGVSDVDGVAVVDNGTPVANLSLALVFTLTNGSTDPVQFTTAADGTFDASGLNMTGKISSVAVNTSGYVLRNYYLNPSPPQVLAVTIWVEFDGFLPPPPSGGTGPDPSAPTAVSWPIVAVVVVGLWGVAGVAIVRLTAFRPQTFRYPALAARATQVGYRPPRR